MATTGTNDNDIIIPGFNSEGVTGDEPSNADDTIDARLNSDIVDGGGGADTIDGGGGDDTLIGGDGNDTLIGGDDNDTLIGGDGNDTLDGGAGDDLLTGGDNQDTFVFTGDNGADTIGDFTDVVDKIDLRAYAVSDVSDFVIEQQGANTIISGYDGAGNTITLENFDKNALTNDDFIFEQQQPPPQLAILPPTIRLDEGDDGDTIYEFTVLRDGDTRGESSVEVVFSPGTDDPSETTDADDFGGSLPEPKEVTFNAGDTEQTVVITVSGDTVVEAEEAFTLTLQSPVGAGILGSFRSATGRILNDDVEPPVLSIQSAIGNDERDDGTREFTFNVQRSGDTTGESSVNVVFNHVNTDDDDFGGTLPESQRVTFAQGETSQQVKIPVSGDTDVEPDETFTLTLADPDGATINEATSTAVGTIFDDDAPQPEISITPPDIPLDEGNDGATTAYTYTLTRTGTEGTPLNEYSFVQVRFDQGETTADDFVDMPDPRQWVTFAPDQEVAQVTIEVSGDTDREVAETFTLTLENPSGATINEAASTATGTINNDDGDDIDLPPPQLAILPPTIRLDEGDDGDTIYEFTVLRDGDTRGESSVEVVFSPGTDDPSETTDADDFGGSLPLPQEVTFNAGDTEQTVVITVSGDTVVEAEEAFTLTLQSPVGAGILGSFRSATGRILNDDVEPPVLSIQSAIGNDERDDGTREFTFNVQRNGDTTGESSVDVVFNHVNTDDDDFGGTLPESQRVTFAQGETSQQVKIPVSGDMDVEPDETFTLTLADPDGATINEATSTAVGTIFDDDAPQPEISITPPDIPLDEGNDGATTAYTYTLTRTGTEGTPLTEYSFVQVRFDQGETTADDFVDMPDPRQWVTFAPDQEEAQVTIEVSGDTDLEVAETFTLTLENPSGATINEAASTATGTINNDDGDDIDLPPPQLAILPPTIRLDEGDDGDTIYEFTVLRDGDTRGESSVEVVFSPGTDDPSETTDADDFGGSLPLPQEVTFNAGDTEQTVVITVSGDTVVEAEEAFTLTLQSPVGAEILGSFRSATGRILNDDVEPPVLSIQSFGDDERDGGTREFIFTVSRGGDTTGESSVDVVFNHVNTDDADFGGSLPDPPRVNFAANEKSQQVTITVSGDTDVEDDETFTLTLENPEGATINEEFQTAVGTIFDDDGEPASDNGGNSIYISDVQIEEGSGDTPTEAVFNVTLSTSVDAPVTVDFVTADGTATAGSDYTAVEGTLTFAPGETVQEVRVPITGDGAVEPNESFFVNLSNPVNDVIADGQGAGTIWDDDGSGVDKTGTSADEVLDGTDGDDVLQGGNGDDALSGAAGDDALTGGAGDDTLDGGTGDDILAGGSDDDTLHGDAGDDVLGGGSGNDVLEGGAGDDNLVGGSGNDQLTGGTGNDGLIGGSGSDTFVFRATDGDSGQDTIHLFNADEDTLAFEDYGESLNAFSDLDTSGNGVLDEADDHVSVDAGDTVIDLGGQTEGESEGTLTLVGVTGLVADDMAFS